MACRTSPCAPFVQPTYPDLGQCFPRRAKRDCNPQSPLADELEGQVCQEEVLEITATPSLVPPFRIVSVIFDEDCDDILDENNLSLSGPTY